MDTPISPPEYNTYAASLTKNFHTDVLAGSMEQKPVSFCGIRSYKRWAVLSPHVDRLPLVGSCIINVAQDVEEDWQLELYDRHDPAVNITMVPGDMVLYESGSLLHGT